LLFFFSSRRRHTRFSRDWSSDVCSSDLLDPEQNHLFHDKYTETTIDIDLSNCHFFLTANTLDGVPPVVVNRCEVITLSQYSVERSEERRVGKDSRARRGGCQRKIDSARR